MKLLSRESPIGMFVFPHKSEIQYDSEQIATQFINSLFKEFCALCYKYISNPGTIDSPYEYSERQLDTCLMPALWKICNGYVMAEQQVTRHIRGEKINSSGRIDYWCYYKYCTFLIEVKHSKWRGSLTKEAKHRWNVLTNYQLKTFVKSEIRNGLTMGDLCIPIGLHFLSSKNINENQKDELEDMYQAHLHLSSSRNSPNYCCSFEPNIKRNNLIEKRIAIIARINQAIS